MGNPARLYMANLPLQQRGGEPGETGSDAADGGGERESPYGSRNPSKQPVLSLEKRCTHRVVATSNMYTEKECCDGHPNYTALRTLFVTGPQAVLRESAGQYRHAPKHDQVKTHTATCRARYRVPWPKPIPSSPSIASFGPLLKAPEQRWGDSTLASRHQSLPRGPVPAYGRISRVNAIAGKTPCAPTSRPVSDTDRNCRRPC